MNNSKYVARGGLYTALGVLFIYLSSVTPTSKLYILGIASCIIPLSIMTTKIQNSFFVYIATSLLSLLILGVRSNVLAYILFFGLYGFAKFYIERLRNIPIEIFLKLFFFNISIGITYLLYNIFFTGLYTVNIPVYAFILIRQVIFLVFDYALTVFINYISRRFLK